MSKEFKMKCPKCGEETKTPKNWVLMICSKCVKFFEDFPSMPCNQRTFTKKEIKENCIDIQKVRDAMEKAYDNAEPPSGFCDDAESAITYYREKLLKELGLEE